MDRNSGTAKFEFSAALDVEHLRMIYEDDVERASVIFQIFVKNVREELALLQTLNAGGQADDLLKMVHKIAPNFSMVGLTSDTMVLSAMESAMKAGGLTDDLKRKLAEFISNVEPRLELVEKELKRINSFLE